LTWEVHACTSWRLWKNGTLIRDGIIKENLIEIGIENWQLEDWRPGTYNLTLEVTNEHDKSTWNTVWIDFILNLGDAYADAVVIEYSIWSIAGTKALDTPDGEHAIIYPDYIDGYLTLDMGANEEIIDDSLKVAIMLLG
jgi:hypothetical protein